MFSEITLPARLDSKIGRDFPHNTPIASELTPTNKIPNIKEIINNLTNLIFPAAYAYDVVKEEQASSVAEANGQMGWRKVTDYLKNMVNDTVDIEGKSVDDTVSEVVTVVVNPADTVITIMNGVDDTVKSEEGVNIQETKIEDAQTEVKVTLENMSDYIEKVTEEVKLINSSMQDTADQVRENISSIKSLNTQDVNRAKEFFGEVRVLVEELNNNLKATENSSDYKVLFEEFFNRLSDICRDYVEDLGQAANVRVVNEEGLKVEAKAEQKSEDTLVLSVKENITAGQKVNREGAQSEVTDAGAAVITAQGMILPPARIDIPAAAAAVSAEAAVNTAGASVHNNINNSSVGIVSQTIYVNTNGISAEYNSDVNVLSDQNNPPTTTGPPRINCAAYALSAYYGIGLEAAAAILSQYTTYNTSTKQYETSLEGLKIASGLQAREFKVSEISQLSGKNLLVVNGNHVVEYDADKGMVMDNGSEMTLSGFMSKYGLNDDTVISGLVSVEVGSEMNAEKLANIKVSWGASWGAAASAAASSGSSGSYGGVSWGGSSGSSFSSGRSSGGSSSYGGVVSSVIGGSYSYSGGSYGGGYYSDDSSYSTTSSALISSVVSNFSSFSYTSYSDTSYNITAPAFNFNAISTTSLSNYAPIYSTSFSLAPSVIANFSAFSSALSSSLMFGQTMSAFGGGFFGGTANVGNPISLQDFSSNHDSYSQNIQTQVFTALGGANYAQVQPMIGAAMNGGITHIDLNPGNEYGATSLEINGSSAVIVTPSFISASVSAAKGNADTFSAYCQITAAHETTEAETGSHYQALAAEAHVAQKSNLTAEQLASWYETLHSGYESDANKAESYASRMMLAAGIAAEGETFVKALDEAEKALNVVTETGTPAQQQAAYVMQGDLFLALDKAVNASKADNSAEVKEVNYEARAKESYEKAAAMDTEHLVSMYANYMLMQMETNEENINVLMERSKEALDQALKDDTLKADTMLSFLLSNNLLPADRYVELCYVMSCSLGKAEGIDTSGNSPMLQLSWLDKAASRIETAGEGQVNTDLAGNVYLQKSELEYNIGLLTGDSSYKELAYKDIERAEELNPSDKAVWENHLQYLLADKDYDKFNALLTDISHNNIALSPQDNASIVGTYGQHFLWDTMKANNNDSEKTLDILKEQGWYECFIQCIEAQAHNAGLKSDDGSSFYANWILSSEGVWHVLVLQSSGVWDAKAAVMVTNPFTNETVNLNSPEILQNMFLIAPAIDGQGDDFKVAFVNYNKLFLEENKNDGGEGPKVSDGSSLFSSSDQKTITATFATISNPASDETPVIEVTGDKPVEITNSYLGDVVINAGDHEVTLTKSQGEKVEVIAEDKAQIEVSQNGIQDLTVQANESVITENTGDILKVNGNENVVSGNKMESGISSKGDQNVLFDNYTFGFLTSEGDGNSLYDNFALSGIESIGDDNDIVNNRTEGDLKSVGDYNDIFSNTVGGNLSSSGEHNEIGYNSVAGNLISTGDYNTLVSNTVAGSMYSIGDRNTLGYNKVGENIVSIGDYNALISNTVVGSVYSTGDRNIVEYNQVGGNIVSSGDYNTVAFNTVAGSVYSEGVRNTIEYNQVGGNIYSIGSYNVIEHNIVGGDIVSSGDYNTINYNQVGGSVYSAGDYNTLTNNLIAGDLVSYGDYNLIGANQIGGSLFSTGDNNSVISNIVTGDINVSGNNNYVNGNISGGLISVNGINNIFGMNVQLSELAGYVNNSQISLSEGAEALNVQANSGLLMNYAIIAGGMAVGSDSAKASAPANGTATGGITSGVGQGNTGAVNTVMEAIGFTIKDTSAVIGQYGNMGSVSAQEGAVSATGKRGEGGDITYAGVARGGFEALGREITDAAKTACERAGETVKEISGSKFSPGEVKDDQAQENNNPLMRAQEVINAQNKMADAFDRLQEVSSTGRSAVNLPYNPGEAVSGRAGRSGADGSGNPSIKGSNTIINQYPGLTGGILNSNRPVSEWAEGSLSGRGPPEAALSLFSSIVSSSNSVFSILDSSNPNGSTINDIIDSLNGIIGEITTDVSSGTALSTINGDFRGQGPDASSYLEAPALIVSSAVSGLPNTHNAQATQTKGGESWVSSILSSQTTASHFLAAGMGLAGHVSSTFSANRSGDTSTAGGKISAGNLPTQSGIWSAGAETVVRPSGSDSSAVFSDELLSVKSSDSAPGTAEALAAMESWNGILLNGDRSYSEYISATGRDREDIKSSGQEPSWTYVKGTSFAVQAPSTGGRYSIGVYGRGARAAAQEAKTGAGSVFSAIVSETAQNGENTLSRDYVMADTDNDGRGDSKVITAGRVYSASGREVYHADYIGKSFTLAEFQGEELTARESITFNPDNSIGTYSRESGYTAISGINAEIASDTWQIDYNKAESIHEVLNATDNPGEYISTITVRGAGGEEITIAGTKDYSITGDGGWKAETSGSIVSHGETLGSYMRMAEYDAGGVLREYSGRFDFNESGAASGYRDQTFGAELEVNDEGVLSGLTISYEMDGSNGDKLADYSYRISDIDYPGSGTGAADEGFYTLAAFGQMLEECFEVDMFNMETVYAFARENGVQSYTYDFSYDGRIGGKEEGAGGKRALSERMSGRWQLLESSVMRGGYAWSEKGEYAEQYTDSAGVENNTGLAAAKAYTFEQHYVDAKGLTLPAGTVESGYGLMRMDGGVFSMAVVKGEAVDADGGRRSVYYGVAQGEARGESGADAGSASVLGMGGSVLGNYLEEYYTPETMQGAGAFDIEVNLVLMAGENGAIFGFNKDYMLTSGQVSSPEYEMSGMPYGWYAWHCEGAISPVLQNPNHQVPASLRTDENLAAQYASQAYPTGNYVYSPVGRVNGQVAGVYMTYQDNDNNYLLGQAVVPTGDGRSYIYNIYTANPGYYGDNAVWQAANRYIVENLENNGSAMFGVQTLAFTRAGDPANPSQYIPLSRIREYNGDDCSMYPQDKSFAKAMGFSYSENLAQMPREIESFWMSNSRVTEQDLSSNQWVMNPLQNMVQAGSLTALGNYVLGGEMEYGCSWEGVLTLVDRGIDGDVYSNNRGNYYKTIGIGGFMITTVPVVSVEGLGWSEYITDANNNIFVQYAPASGVESAVYAYYDQSTGRAVTGSANSFMRFYQVEGVGVVPVTVGLTGEGWVPVGGAQAQGEQVWVTPVQGGENIYERLEYDAQAEAPWAGTGEYYRQDGDENWVRATAPAAAVTLEERVFDCEKYSVLTNGKENNIGYNADNDCAALAYAYLAAKNSGEEISGKEFSGLADNFKAASGMNDNGVSIEQMLKGFYSLGMNYKYEEVPSLEGLEAGAVILTEEDGMLHAMVLADNSGPRATVYTCEDGWGNGGVELENTDPEDLTVKGALIPAGTDASGFARSREITISVSSPGSIFYDNEDSYLYTETYFDAKGEVTGTTSHTEENDAYFSGSVRKVAADGGTGLYCWWTALSLYAPAGTTQVSLGEEMKVDGSGAVDFEEMNSKLNDWGWSSKLATSDAEDLKQGYIVKMTMDGEGHCATVLEVNAQGIMLMDNTGVKVYELQDFEDNYFAGQAITDISRTAAGESTSGDSQLSWEEKAVVWVASLLGLSASAAENDYQKYGSLSPLILNYGEQFQSMDIDKENAAANLAHMLGGYYTADNLKQELTIDGKEGTTVGKMLEVAQSHGLYLTPVLTPMITGGTGANVYSSLPQNSLVISRCQEDGEQKYSSYVLLENKATSADTVYSTAYDKDGITVRTAEFYANVWTGLAFVPTQGMVPELLSSVYSSSREMASEYLTSQAGKDAVVGRVQYTHSEADDGNSGWDQFIYPFSLSNGDSGNIQILMTWRDEGEREIDQTQVTYVLNGEAIDGQRFESWGLSTNKLSNGGTPAKYNSLVADILSDRVDNLLVTARDAGRSYGGAEGPLIISDSQTFKDTIQSCLNDLKAKAPEYYNLINQNVLVITSEITDVGGTCFGSGVFAMSADDSEHWWTLGAMVHEAAHAKDYKDGLEYDPATNGKDWEVRAMNAELAALKVVGASQEAITAAEQELQSLDDSATAAQWYLPSIPYFFLLASDVGDYAYAVSHDGWSADKLTSFFGGDWWQEGDIRLVGSDSGYEGSIEKAYALRADYYAAAGMPVPDTGYTFAEVSKDAVAKAPEEYQEYTGSLFDIGGERYIDFEKDNTAELAVRSDLLADAEVLAGIMIHEDAHVSGQAELAARQEEIKFAVWEALDSYYPSAEEAMEGLSIGLGSEDWNTKAFAYGVIESFSSVIGAMIKESEASDGLRIYGFYILNSAYEGWGHPVNPAEDTLKIALDGIRADEDTMNFFYRQVALEDDFSSVLPAIKQYFGGDWSLPLAMAAYNNYNNSHDLHTQEGPRALVLLPRYDYQNPDYHFYGSGGTMIRELCLGGGTANQVMVYVVPDEGSFIQAAQTVAGYDAVSGVSSKPVDTLVMNGHGEKGYFRVGRDDDAGEIDRSDKGQLTAIRSALKEGGTVIINACSTGEGGLKGGNLANTIAAVFTQAAHVYAADAISYNCIISFDDKGHAAGVDLDTVTTWDFALKQRPAEGEDLSLFVATVAASTGGTIGTSAGALRNSDLVTAVFGDGSTYYLGYDNSEKAQEAGKRLAALDADSMVTAGVGANTHCSGCSTETYYGPNLAPAPTANILTAGGAETLPLERSI